MFILDDFRNKIIKEFCNCSEDSNFTEDLTVWQEYGIACDNDCTMQFYVSLYESTIADIIECELSKTSVNDLRKMWINVIDYDEVEAYAGMNGTESIEYINKSLKEYFVQAIHISALGQDLPID